MTEIDWYKDFWNGVRREFVFIGAAIIVSNLISAGAFLFVALKMLSKK